MEFIELLGRLVFFLVFLLVMTALFGKEPPKRKRPRPRVPPVSPTDEEIIEYLLSLERGEEPPPEKEPPRPLPPIRTPPVFHEPIEKPSYEEKFRLHSRVEDRSKESRITTRKKAPSIRETTVVHSPLEQLVSASRAKPKRENPSKIATILDNLPSKKLLLLTREIMRPPKTLRPPEDPLALGK